MLRKLLGFLSWYMTLLVVIVFWGSHPSRSPSPKVRFPLPNSK